MQLGEVHRMGLLRVWDVEEADAGLMIATAPSCFQLLVGFPQLVSNFLRAAMI
jgi:hypothetical protein